MNVAIVVPWRGGDPQRERLWEHCRPWWEQFGWPIYQVEHPPPEPFNRAWCINEGARRAGDWDVLIIVDADTIEHSAEQVYEAVRQTPGHGFVVAHVGGKDLDAEGTELVLADEHVVWHEHLAGERLICDSRVNLVSRELFEDLGGYDTRFRGWGHEDVAFTAAVETLGGPMYRVAGNSWHLWHEPMLPIARRTREWRQGQALADRYLRAHGDPHTIRQILRERTPKQRYDAPHHGPRSNVEVELVVITNGRLDYLAETLASADEHLKGRITRRTMFNDNPHAKAELNDRYRGRFRMRHNRRNVGYSPMMSLARDHLRATPGPEYVFWLEEDFTFRHDVELDQLATLLDEPGMVQAALLRAPYYPREFEAGGIIAEHPESYTAHEHEGIAHLDHQRFFTSNPHLAHRDSFREFVWPRGRHTESRFGHSLWKADKHVCFIGDGEPWIDHIGAERRTGRGY